MFPSNIKRVRQRRVPWQIATAVVVLVGVLLAAGAVVHARAQDTLAPNRNITAIRDHGLRVGQSDDFGVEVENASSDTTLTLRSVSLPNGLPPHVHLQHVIDTYIGLLLTSGWPVNSDEGPVFPTVPLDGARVPPGKTSFVVLVLVADQPGAYVVGPVTIHAEVPGPFGIPIPIEQTLTQYGVLCPGVSASVCHAAPVPGLHG